MAIFTGLLFFVSVFQGWVALGQLKQNAATLEQLKLEQRAWVSVHPQHVELEIGKPVVFQVLLKNSGPTPAYIHQMYSAQGIYAAGTIDKAGRIDVSSLESIKKDPQNVVLAPNSDNTHSVRNLLAPPLSEQTYNDVAAFTPRRELYWIMQIHYRDVWDNKRFTQICFTYDPASRKPKVCLHSNVLQ